MRSPLMITQIDRYSDVTGIDHPRTLSDITSVVQGVHTSCLQFTSYSPCMAIDFLVKNGKFQILGLSYPLVHTNVCTYEIGMQC